MGGEEREEGDENGFERGDEACGLAVEPEECGVGDGSAGGEAETEDGEKVENLEGEL